ncbi:hypothetical protein EX30DRAFT_398764 [Ascodesmis nigricans]|uniref:Uncharacterized protein n=1 Tax=Ascodesmis nigricans TaxID=341454 RepID=A0A4S2MJP4_9PEZI|nr:hypothetical protein EX30DRAFT_398764 [Ascodesmis nigricans]
MFSFGFAVGYLLIFFRTLDYLGNILLADIILASHLTCLGFVVVSTAGVMTLTLMENEMQGAGEYHGAGPCVLSETSPSSSSSSLAVLPEPVLYRLLSIEQSFEWINVTCIVAFIVASLASYAVFVILPTVSLLKEYFQTEDQLKAWTRLFWAMILMFVLAALGVLVPVGIVVLKLKSLRSPSRK